MRSLKLVWLHTNDTVSWVKYLCEYGHGLVWDLLYHLLQFFKDQQELTGCCQDDGTSPGSGPLVRANQFQDTLPFTEKTHVSLAPTCFPWMVCIVALGAISKKGKRKGPGTYRPASLTPVPGKITQPGFLGCISKQVKNKKFKVVINMDLPGTNDVQQTWAPPITKWQGEACGCDIPQL